MDIKAIIGERIREAREKLDLTQEQLADRLGKTRNTISSYETGTRILSISELPDLAKALEVPISYFFEDERIESTDLDRVRKTIGHLDPRFKRGLIEVMDRSELMQVSLAKQNPGITDGHEIEIYNEPILVLGDNLAIAHYSERIPVDGANIVSFELRISVLGANEEAMNRWSTESMVFRSQMRSMRGETKE